MLLIRNTISSMPVPYILPKDMLKFINVEENRRGWQPCNGFAGSFFSACANGFKRQVYDCNLEGISKDENTQFALPKFTNITARTHV